MSCHTSFESAQALSELLFVCLFVYQYQWRGLCLYVFFILAEYNEKAFNNSVNTSSTAVTGHPALSINVGFSNGLPVGMMIVGKKFDEATVLNVAYAYEKIRDSAT